MLNTKQCMENYKKHLQNIIDLTDDQWVKIENILVEKKVKKNEFILSLFFDIS